MWGSHAVESVQKLGRTLEASRHHEQSQISTDRPRANIESRGDLNCKTVTARDPSADCRDSSHARHLRRTEGQLFLLRILPLTVPFFFIGGLLFAAFAATISNDRWINSCNSSSR